MPPERNYDALDNNDRQALVDYVPGYDWIPGRFGPPPGIPKMCKDEFDRMNDKEYLYAFLKLTQEEKESLMVSEVERRRTFKAHWPIETLIKANDCAKEGFYYTGVADRVQCCFCAGIVRNWERGDVPKLLHRNFFDYCKIVLNRPCQNIPVNECGLPKDIMTDRMSQALRDDASSVATLGELAINTIRPKDAAMSVYGKRLDTYKGYAKDRPVSAKSLCDAGFCYEGVGDKVKCFWCDGELETWSEGDDPWVEHSKWYPGCIYLQQTKGCDFIKKARSKMTLDNFQVAEGLSYNVGDVSFLTAPREPKKNELDVTKHEGFKVCRLLLYKECDIRKAYSINNDKEFDDQATLVTIVQLLDENEHASLDGFRGNEPEKVENVRVTTTKPKRSINVTKIITSLDEPNERDAEDLKHALTCKKCMIRTSAAVTLPCGCLCLCHECSRSSLPIKCPACGVVVKGALRTYLS